MTKGKLTVRQERLSKMLDYMDKGVNTVEDLAAALDLRESAVGPLMAEILASKMDAISSRDVEILVKKSAANYEMLIHESMNDLKKAKTVEDRQRVFEGWRRAQEAQDKLFGLCGIYVKREKKEITTREVEDSPAWRQMSGLMEEFLYTLGIDYKRWSTFVKDRAMGKITPIDVEAKEIDPGKVPFVANHRHATLGNDSRSMNLNKYVPGYKEVNTLKSKYMLGNMSQEEEDEIFSMLPMEDQTEFLEWKERIDNMEEVEGDSCEPTNENKITRPDDCCNNCEVMDNCMIKENDESITVCASHCRASSTTIM